MRAYLTATLLVALGCTGSIADPSADPNNPDDPRYEPLVCGEMPVVPATIIRRLTRDQYDLTVRHLLGDDSAPARAFPADDDTEGFYVGGVASNLLVEAQRAAAEALAERASMDISAIVPCEAGSDCADEIVSTLGRRAYRRPLTDAEHARLRDVFDIGEREEGSFAGGVKLALQALLQSPSFLYHVETIDPSADDGDVVAVEDFALASRLSYFLWASMPDDALLDAAATGELRDTDGLLAQARRMLDDPRSREGFRSFYRQWLQLDGMQGVVKDPTEYPDFNDAVRDDLERSLEAFLDDTFLSGDSTALFTSESVWVNARTAPIFGLDPAEYGDELEEVTLAGRQRAGMLTHPALMTLFAKANQSDPIHRAKFVRERILCQHLPSPPDDIVVVAPDPAPGLTTRERFAEHSDNPACAGCHVLLDGLGFGFEHYDGIGRWRDEDSGAPVDATGDMVGTEDLDGSFYGAVELSERMADSAQVHRCVSRQLFRFALQRVELREDGCSLDSVDAAFAESNWDLRELMLAIVTSDAFRYQQVSR